MALRCDKPQQMGKTVARAEAMDDQAVRDGAWCKSGKADMTRAAPAALRYQCGGILVAKPVSTAIASPARKNIHPDCRVRSLASFPQLNATMHAPTAAIAMPIPMKRSVKVFMVPPLSGSCLRSSSTRIRVCLPCGSSLPVTQGLRLSCRTVDDRDGVNLDQVTGGQRRHAQHHVCRLVISEQFYPRLFYNRIAFV